MTMAEVCANHFSRSTRLFSLGATMVPDILICSECGRAAVVLSWSPVRDDIAEQAALDDSDTAFVFYKIDCATCGTRIQSTVPPRDETTVA
jgi:hypothetical protein